MMLECKYCGGSGKLHDDADAFDDHEEPVIDRSKITHKLLLELDQIVLKHLQEHHPWS